ncbi:Major Facilitator Superfamily protein [Rubritalea squalenifaciens DSM 18772]|uniref:Major Facilitator Superfamily protein n=1 Tax=Rubritalea squalenifaciens DSM 18772 TaxID=1123071 RepID=A0A1M6HF35_9BACT|nr:MFS transporter [Rubritalea squalenifaciens]SHJ20812.1 Major Facilitator Superfamily protein [Rubritalea squalenifaciens DSM 18772]
MDTQLTEKERKTLFWACFLSLAAAGFGFAFRVLKGGEYGGQLGLDNHEVGQIFGASLWPIAITMIGFSLIIDKTGYKWPMFGAFVLQLISAVGTCFATSYAQLYGYAILAGLGHGIIECVINPVTASIYNKQKTKMLTILHAAWPCGIVASGLLIISTSKLPWGYHSLWMAIPVVIYGVLFLKSKFPVDERVKAGVPYMEMLKQVGFLSAALASFLLIFEIGNQTAKLTTWELPANWFYISLGAGAAVGLLFGAVTKSIGKPLFFLMCLLMIPLATAELGTDQWISKLMRPVLEGMDVNPGFALVISAGIMMFFRFFAGNVLKFFSPPALLAISGILSAAGLIWLSSATSVAIFIAFVLYALGQTYYWPCVLGFVAERYPRGGALTLNTVSAIGLLSVGIIGGQLLGIAFDKSIHDGMTKDQPALVQQTEQDKNFLWMHNKTIDAKKFNTVVDELPETEKETAKADFTANDKKAGRDVLKYAAQFPIVLAIAFGFIALYFKSRGGYKPVELEASWE